MIRYTIKIILIILTLILLAPIVFAISTKDFQQIKNEAESLCTLYNTRCTITVVDSDTPGAITKEFGKIEVSTKLLDILNSYQVRAVIYHEVGHVVLKHVDKTIDYFAGCGKFCNPDYIAVFRRQYELQADRFSLYTCMFTNKSCDLEGALLKLTPPERVNKSSSSHPSTAKRILQIRRIYNALQYN